jgi:hypothetical protein
MIIEEGGKYRDLSYKGCSKFRARDCHILDERVVPGATDISLFLVRTLRHRFNTSQRICRVQTTLRDTRAVCIPNIDTLISRNGKTKTCNAGGRKTCSLHEISLAHRYVCSKALWGYRRGEGEVAVVERSRVYILRFPGSSNRFDMLAVSR